MGGFSLSLVSCILRIITFFIQKSEKYLLVPVLAIEAAPAVVQRASDLGKDVLFGVRPFHKERKKHEGIAVSRSM